MTLHLEDGTGVAEAETYVSLVEFQAHCAAWGYDLAGKSDADQEVGLRKATAFIDTFARYKGKRLVATQALEFPREGLTDWGGHAVTGVPARVKRACMELAFKALSAELQEDLARGGRVQSESVGPLSVTYAADAPAGTVYQLAQKLLEPLVREALPYLNGPGRVAPSGAIFSLGLHDAPGTSAYEE